MTMLRLKFVLPLLLFILLVLLFGSSLRKDPNLLPSRLIGQTLPTFVAQTLEGNQAITNEGLKGKVSVLNVWATWCEVCPIEHPFLLDLAKQNIAVYGLNYKDDRASAIRYLQEKGNPYQQVIYDADGKLAMQFGVYGTPETYLIDKNGIIRNRYVGPITLDLLEKDLLPKIKRLAEEE